MKHIYFKNFALLGLAIALGSSLAIGLTEYESANNHKSYALSKSYTSLKGLVEDSPVIVKGEFTGEYHDMEIPMEESDGELHKVIRVYKVNVNKVYKSDSDDVKKNSIVEIYQQIGVRGKDDDKSKLLPTVEKELLEVQEGTYILFLNYDTEKRLKNSTPNHIYKLKKNDKYENLVGGKLGEIDEVTLEEKIKKQ